MIWQIRVGIALRCLIAHQEGGRPHVPVGFVLHGVTFAARPDWPFWFNEPKCSRYLTR